MIRLGVLLKKVKDIDFGSKAERRDLELRLGDSQQSLASLQTDYNASQTALSAAQRGLEAANKRTESLEQELGGLQAEHTDLKSRLALPGGDITVEEISRFASEKSEEGYQELFNEFLKDILTIGMGAYENRHTGTYSEGHGIRRVVHNISFENMDRKNKVSNINLVITGYFSGSKSFEKRFDLKIDKSGIEGYKDFVLALLKYRNWEGTNLSRYPEQWQKWLESDAMILMQAFIFGYSARYYAALRNPKDRWHSEGIERQVGNILELQAKSGLKDNQPLIKRLYDALQKCSPELAAYVDEHLESTIKAP